MNIDILIRMVNQIGAFFEAMPDRAEALQGIAQHLKSFWEPRMRRALLEHVDRGGQGDLSSMVAEAIRLHRQILG